MNDYISAIAVLNDKIKGYVVFTETKNNKVKVSINLTGVPKGYHGFHIHETGNLLEGCKSCKSHFNPYNKNHGGRNSKDRHVGDLGNIKADDKGNVKLCFTDDLIKLRGKKCNIIGRSVIIHSNKDDLGKGGDKESLKTGNAGKRIGCAVIGYKTPYYY